MSARPKGLRTPQISVDLVLLEAGDGFQIVLILMSTGWTRQGDQLGPLKDGSRKVGKDGQCPDRSPAAGARETEIALAMRMEQHLSHHDIGTYMR